MGICKIGEKKKIDGKWYTKEAAAQPGQCDGCSIESSAIRCPIHNGDSHRAVEDGGGECCGTVWIASDRKLKKPAKPAPKAKWAKIPLDTNITKSGLIDIANQLGAENARLKNQITKIKGDKA